MGKCITDPSLGMDLTSLDDLDKIQLDEYTFLDDEDLTSSDEEQENDCADVSVPQSTSNPSKKRKRKVSKDATRNPPVRRKWSDAENNVIQKHFGNHINQRQIPSKALIIERLPQLPGRTWRNVKDKVRNMFTKQ